MFWKAPNNQENKLKGMYKEQLLHRSFSAVYISRTKQQKIRPGSRKVDYIIVVDKSTWLGRHLGKIPAVISLFPEFKRTTVGGKPGEAAVEILLFIGY